MLLASTLGAIVAMEGADVGLIDGADWEGLNRGLQETSKVVLSIKAGPGDEEQEIIFHTAFQEMVILTVGLESSLHKI